MHIITDLLTAQEAVAWAGISPTCLRGDLYNNHEEKIGEGVDIVFASEKICNYGNTEFAVRGIEIFAGETNFSLNNTNKAIVWLEPRS